MGNELAAIEDTVDDIIVALMDSAVDEFTPREMTALPYLFSGMSPNQVSQALTPILGEVVTPDNVRAWLRKSTYARLVSQGRSLMRQWNIMQLQQLVVMSYDILRRNLTSVPVDDKDRMQQEANAKFIIREMAKTRPREVKHSVDVPSMYVAANISAAIVAERINIAYQEPIDIVRGEFETIDHDGLDSVSQYDGVKPKYGVLNVDWEENRTQCHVCDEWHNHLYTHVSEAHEINIKAYKEAYGIPPDLSLHTGRLTDRLTDTGITWMGRKIVVMDEEKELCPYDMTFEQMKIASS